jgi:hypothetical protein
VTGVTVVCIAAAAKATHQQSGIEPDNRLRVSIAPDEAASGPDKAMHFKVTFSNLRSEDLTLIPGTLIACGMTPSKTSAVKLNLTGPQGERHRHLPYLGDGPPYQFVCAGQFESYVVVLHRGESVSLPLEIGKYVDLSDSKQYDCARFPAGEYSLQTELTTEPSEIPKSMVKTKKVWTGTVTSNIVQVQFASEFLELISCRMVDTLADRLPRGLSPRWVPVTHPFPKVWATGQLFHRFISCCQRSA